MDHPLGDAFPVEVRHCVQEYDILQEDRPVVANRQRGGYVVYWHPVTSHHSVAAML
jgi:hypothetical protein